MKDNAVERQEFLDIVKGIGICLMVIGHSGAPALVTQYIYAFHMPLFFIVSGYLYQDLKWKAKGFKGLVKKRLRDYVLPYFALSFVNLVLNIGVESRTLQGKELLASTIEHVFWIFYSGGTAERTPKCTPLWFLLGLFLCSIYMYFLMLIENKWKRWVVCLSLVAGEVLLIKCGIPPLPWQMDSALSGVGFMLIGYEIKEQKILEGHVFDGRWILGMFALGSAAAFSNGLVDILKRIMNQAVLYWTAAVLLSFTLIWFCYQYLNRCRPIAYLGRNTIFVMGFNYFLNGITEFAWTHIPVLNQVEYVWWCKSMVVLLCCGIGIGIWNRVKLTFPTRRANC